MAIVREQGAVNSSTSDVASIAVTLSGSASDGNLLIGTAGRRTVSGVGAITEPTGFTEKIQSELNGTRNRTQVSYKVASSDGTGPFTFACASQNQEICASVTEWSGMNTSSFTGDTDSSLNLSTTRDTTSISVTTTGSLSLLMFAMTHSDRDAGTFSGLGYSNSFSADIAITVDVDQNDVNHYTATRIVTSPTAYACVSSWTDTPRISSQCLVELFGATATGPTVTVPTGYLPTNNLGPRTISGISVAAGDNAVTLVTCTCTLGKGTMTMTASGSSMVSGNGTNAISIIGGSEMDINNTLATFAFTGLEPTRENVTVAMLATDGTLNDTANLVLFNHRTSLTIVADSYADLVAMIQTAKMILPQGVPSGTVTITATDDDTLEDEQVITLFIPTGGIAGTILSFRRRRRQ